MFGEVDRDGEVVRAESPELIERRVAGADDLDDLVGLIVAPGEVVDRDLGGQGCGERHGDRRRVVHEGEAAGLGADVLELVVEGRDLGVAVEVRPLHERCIAVEGLAAHARHRAAAE